MEDPRENESTKYMVEAKDKKKETPKILNMHEEPLEPQFQQLSYLKTAEE